MKKYQREENLSWRRIEDEILIIDSRINQEVHRLNGVGSLIWEKCDGRDTDSIVNELIKEYDVTKVEAENDVNSFISSLLDKKIILES